MKKAKILLLGVFTASCLFFLPRPQLFPQKPAQTRDSDVRRIALDAIWTNSGQKGLRPVPADPKSLIVENLQLIREEGAALGATDLFLVYGKDLTQAVRATCLVFLGLGSTDSPYAAPADREERVNDVWLVIYLGMGEKGAVDRSIKSVQWQGGVIRVGYQDSKTSRGLEGKNKMPILAWARLGVLPPRRYRLELSDWGSGEVRLLRFVTVCPRDQ